MMSFTVSIHGTAKSRFDEAIKGTALEWVSEVQDGQADVDFALRQAKPLL